MCQFYEVLMFNNVNLRMNLFYFFVLTNLHQSKETAHDLKILALEMQQLWLQH